MLAAEDTAARNSAFRKKSRQPGWSAGGLDFRRLRSNWRRHRLRYRCNDRLRGCGCTRLRWSHAAVLLKAGAAQHRPPLCRPEGDGRLHSAYRTVRPRFRAHARASTPLQLACLAALGIVVKLLVVKKKLLTGGEDEILPAIHAFQYLVLKFHDPVACRSTAKRQLPPPRKSPNLPGPATEAALLHLQQQMGEENWERGTRSSVGRRRHRGPAIVSTICGPG